MIGIKILCCSLSTLLIFSSEFSSAKNKSFIPNIRNSFRVKSQRKRKLNVNKKSLNKKIMKSKLSYVTAKVSDDRMKAIKTRLSIPSISADVLSFITNHKKVSVGLGASGSGVLVACCFFKFLNSHLGIYLTSFQDKSFNPKKGAFNDGVEKRIRFFTGTPYVFKYVRNSDRNQRSIQCEIEAYKVLKDLNDKRIKRPIKYSKKFFSGNCRFIYEFADGMCITDFADYLDNQNKSNKEKLLISLKLQKEICEIYLEFMKKGYNYHDLNPGNFVIAVDQNDNYSVKVFDFGKFEKIQKNPNVEVGPILSIENYLMDNPFVNKYTGKALDSRNGYDKNTFFKFLSESKMLESRSINLRNCLLAKLHGNDEYYINSLLPYYGITDEEARQICDGQKPKPCGVNVNIEKLVKFLDTKIIQLGALDENNEIFKVTNINSDNILGYVNREQKMKN